MVTSSNSRGLFTDEELSEQDIEQLKKSSSKFVGKWNKLVSSTNWEKGDIISKWREALIEKGSPATDYSDEAWSKVVGGVSSQHVGRLRRVFQRFGETHNDYKGLFWTHFCAALEWDDAEMWLEGAVQNSWSVSKMRNHRWETMGAIAKDKPSDLVAGEMDEDFEPSSLADPTTKRVVGKYDEIAAGPRHEDPDFGDEESDSSSLTASDSKKKKKEPKEKIDPVRPFEDIPELPEDIEEAFEAFKLAILNHKALKWDEIELKDLIKCLDALKVLAKAPSAD